MHETEPSRTALAAATYRAFHQILDGARLFKDPLALTILGDDARLVEDSARANAQALNLHRGMRLFVAGRSAIAEARLKNAVEARGVTQLVVLGAGLDTFAYRNPFDDRLKVFEVDHPATQAWKRRRLGEVGIAVPPTLTYAPVDLETENLIEALQIAGFDPARRSFFLWLGVVPYLTRDAIRATLSQIAGLPGGAEVIFDYSDPPETLGKRARAAHKARAERVARVGEPFLSNFEPADLHAELTSLGFSKIDDLGPRELMRLYVRPAVLSALAPSRGGHLIWAATS